MLGLPIEELRGRDFLGSFPAREQILAGIAGHAVAGRPSQRSGDAGRPD